MLKGGTLAQAAPGARRGWRKLDVDDQFLRELAEPGFQELEVVSAADMALLGDEGGLRGLVAKADAELAARCVSAPRCVREVQTSTDVCAWQTR